MRQQNSRFSRNSSDNYIEDSAFPGPEPEWYEHPNAVPEPRFRELTPIEFHSRTLSNDLVSTSSSFISSRQVNFWDCVDVISVMLQWLDPNSMHQLMLSSKKIKTQSFRAFNQRLAILSNAISKKNKFIESKRELGVLTQKESRRIGKKILGLEKKLRLAMSYLEFLVKKDSGIHLGLNTMARELPFTGYCHSLEYWGKLPCISTLCLGGLGLFISGLAVVCMGNCAGVFVASSGMCSAGGGMAVMALGDNRCAPTVEFQAALTQLQTKAQEIVTLLSNKNYVEYLNRILNHYIQELFTNPDEQEFFQENLTESLTILLNTALQNDMLNNAVFSQIQDSYSAITQLKPKQTIAAPPKFSSMQ